MHICVLTAMHLSVEYSERLQRVVIGGLEGGDFLGQRERFILFPSPLEADRLQDLGKKGGKGKGHQSSEEDDFPEKVCCSELLLLLSSICNKTATKAVQAIWLFNRRCDEHSIIACSATVLRGTTAQTKLLLLSQKDALSVSTQTI